ncbi:MAG: acyltransferase [Myxococcaceae bacterium]|nr:acyltransferase [Myxococcaceae bacterium]
MTESATATTAGQTAPAAPRKSRSPFRGHLPALDGVRGLAIGLVLLVHFIGDLPAESRFEKVVMQLATYGSFGVDLFFVLSGFLITGILFDSKADPHFFRNFYARRTLRIFPLYYGVLAVIFLGLRWVPFFQGPQMDELVARQGWAWAYAINVHIAREGTWSLPYLGHFWSLAVEEHFYFLWPLIVWSFKRDTLLKVCVGFIVGSFALRLAMYFADVNALAIYTLTPCRFDGLCLGGFLAVAVRGDGPPEHWLAWLRKAAWRLSVPAFGFIVVTFLINSRTDFGRDVLRPLRESCWAACFAAVVCFALTAKPGGLVAGFFTSKVMTFLGKYSYGLYVFHAMLSYWMLEHHVLDDVLKVVPWHFGAVLVHAALGVGLSVVAALLSYHLYEMRFLGLKARFEAKPH